MQIEFLAGRSEPDARVPLPPELREGGRPAEAAGEVEDPPRARRAHDLENVARERFRGQVLARVIEQTDDSSVVFFQ